jgi:hypothetical protein
MAKLGIIVATLLILGGFVALMGFWPVALILGGLALLAWIFRNGW